MAQVNVLSSKECKIEIDKLTGQIHFRTAYIEQELKLNGEVSDTDDQLDQEEQSVTYLINKLEALKNACARIKLNRSALVQRREKKNRDSGIDSMVSVHSTQSENLENIGIQESGEHTDTSREVESEHIDEEFDRRLSMTTQNLLMSHAQHASDARRLPGRNGSTENAESDI